MSQTTFLGASIVSFSSSLGWGGQTSQLNVTLVEDPANNDQFSPPGVGEPVYFSFNGNTFNGILQNWKHTHGPSGNPLFDVVVVDPREILSGVQLILNGYTGGVVVPNIINIYGFLEGLQFGLSGANESGIPWNSIITGLNSMVASGYGGAYGTTITLRGYNYELDLSQIPFLPAYYRIGGDSISLMDFINETCEAGACDYFFTLEYVNGINFIKLHTISRALAVSEFGKINQFVNNVNAVNKDAGFEFSNVTTSKMVVGGNVRSLWANYYDNNLNNDPFTTQYVYYYPESQGVWPFWGLDAFGNVIIGRGFDNAHRFVLDARQVNVFGISETYYTDVGELRAALDSQSSWELFLSTQDAVAEYNDPFGSTYNNPHYQKATKIGLVTNIHSDLTGLVSATTGIGGIPLNEFAPVQGQNIIKAGGLNVIKEENVKRLYEYVRAYAEEYYGKRVMVRVPFVYTKLNDNGQIVTSQTPVDAGYLDENEWATAYGNNLLPIEVNKITTEDGLIEAYVRFDNAQNLDFSDIDPEALVPGQVMSSYFTAPTFSMFVKCTVDPKLVFLESSTAYGPRAVVTLPGKVTLRESRDFTGVMRDFFVGLLGSQADAFYTQLYQQFGSDNFYFGNAAPAVVPTLAMVPLESNVATYGPWYAIGADGKADFEKDDTLVPWNYGDWGTFNYAGSARILDAYAQRQVQEYGQVEFAGSPEKNLGQALVDGGPYITDITVNISEGGITTTYTMNSWSGNFFKLIRAHVDRWSHISKLNQQMRRELRTKLSIAPYGHPVYQRRAEALVTPRKRVSSSHAMICGELVAVGDGLAAPNVVIQPYYNTITQLQENYSGKAAMSLDGLFRPFSTNKNNTLLSHYEEYETEYDEDGQPIDPTQPTVDDLNPFSENTDIGICVMGSDLPNTLVTKTSDAASSNDWRGVGLRGPMVIVGWGYDTNGKPVPNSKETEYANDPENTELTDEFYPSHKKRSDMWKTGPVDIRWDRKRKIWVAGGGGGSQKIVKITECPDIPNNRSKIRQGEFKKVYKAKICEIALEGEEVGKNVEITETTDEIYVGNFRSSILIKDKYYLANKIEGTDIYIIDNQGVFQEYT